MHIRIFLYSWLLIVQTGIAVAWETTSFRTPTGGLVRVGMTASEALHELGPEARPRKPTKSRNREQVWTVKTGDGRYAVTVSGGAVRKIEVTPDRD